MRIAGTTKGKIRWEQWSRALSNYRLWNRSTKPSPIASNTRTNSGHGWDHHVHGLRPSEAVVVR